ncbi:NADPH2:quinone reductase [Murinocardiopsis flavida]|uniref:NADPH2:quinone reductase n=1 Tax=Murinocardiopsis flavida TaxID=645275 RepID=A0A2P8CXN1_9ACTN|nr:zinc-binding dehydrogenase [Murinocardiopsis flavida]PSK89676.1 NADPH2:quinone reductase [Murinocardiopsis flavida]
MRQITVTRFGGPEVLAAVEGPDPVAGPGEVVVHLAATDVMFFDTLVRSGWAAGVLPTAPPYVPGSGGAGRVAEVGAGVDPAWIGRRVLARTGTGAGESVNPVGGYAERATAAADELIPVPDALGLEEAAALLHDSPTALQLMAAARVAPGERVLVAAAAGGAGTLLVQLAAAAGARVVAAARGAHKLRLASELGAEAAVDYSEDGWAERVRAATGGGADVVFDGAGGRLGRAAFDATAPGGRFLTYGNSDGTFAEIDPRAAEERGATVTGLFDLPPVDAAATRLQVAEALELAVAGRLRPVIGQTYPLERAAEAHTALAARTTVGKSLLLP